MSSGGRSTTTAVQARTRRAILDAAVRVLSADFGAPLAEIARQAGVGRTTLHRYFPERGDLLSAIAADALERTGVAVARTRLDEGPALEALERLCQELFELGDVLMLLFSEPRLMSDPVWEEETDSDRAILAAIARGHAEGAIDPAMPAAWTQELIWALLYTAWEHARTHDVPKHEALGLCLRTLRRAIAV